MEAELFIQITLLIAAVYLAFFKSYLTEKGKSAALKEDLQGLTREVESVKDEFVKEQEILKTDLQRIVNNEISYRNEERDALIQFHGIINEWLYSIDEIGFGNFNKANIESLIEVRKKIASYYAKAGISKSKISLLVTEKELVKKAGELYLNAMTYHHWALKIFLLLQQNCESQKSLTDRFIIIMKNYEGNKEIARQMAEDDEKLRADVKDLTNKYYETKTGERAKVFPFEKDYETLVKEYLKK